MMCTFARRQRNHVDTSFDAHPGLQLLPRHMYGLLRTGLLSRAPSEFGIKLTAADCDYIVAAWSRLRCVVHIPPWHLLHRCKVAYSSGIATLSDPAR